jgi:uncharacterized protein (DUF486 family)
VLAVLFCFFIVLIDRSWSSPKSHRSPSRPRTARFLPIQTLPYVNLSIAAVFQVLAWFGGTLFPGLSIVPRVLVLWLFALVEYIFMSPTMSAAIEILGYSQGFLVVLNHSLALAMFIVLNAFLFKAELSWRHGAAFLLITAAVYLVHEHGTAGG